MPVTAADIPIELYDLVVSFFRLDPDGKGDWIGWDRDESVPYNEEKRREWGQRNRVLAKKHELGWLVLVCHRWARLCQPVIFQEVTLRSRDDVESLLALLAHPKCPIANYIHVIDLSQSLITYPYSPWIHIVVVRLIPKLKQFDEIGPMTVTGPLPAGQSFSSVHGELPTRYPFFAAGIWRLNLNDLHFESFQHLVQPLKELPSLRSMSCTNVTWDTSPDAPLPVATSYLDRDLDTGLNEVGYWMRGCTDDAAAAWLSWLLALTLSWRLEQQHSDALCRIASDLIKKVDAARFPDREATSGRWEDRLYFWAYADGSRLTPWVYVYLTSAVPSERTRRRVRAIRLNFEFMKEAQMSDVVGWDCWPAIDAQLATLPSLRTVLIQADTHNDLVLLANDFVATKLPQLRDSTKLKYAYYTGNDYSLWYTHDTVNSEGRGRWIVDIDAIL